MRGDQLSRQWRLVQLLSRSAGLTLQQLRAELGTSKRTVQRDIAVLEQAGFPVVSEDRNGTVRWKLMQGFPVASSVAFTMPELMALYFGRGMMKPLQGTAMYEAVESGLAKIGANIPAQGHALLRNFDQSIAISHTGWKDYRNSGQVMDSLNRAVSHHFTTEILYRGLQDRASRRRRVDPYIVWFTGGTLYLIAWDHSAKDYRSFAVERIKEVKVTNRRYEPDSGFDFEKLQKTAFSTMFGETQHVVIRFSADQAPYVKERTWHPSQTLTDEPDGGVVLEMDVASLWEVKRWLIGWGGDAVVLAPGELYSEIQNECKRVLRPRTSSTESKEWKKNQ
jgi:predicted DNA-binding transcriptional regulator YafY